MSASKPLPRFLRPGSDLMAKRVICNSDVINIITRHILNCENEYAVGNCEWFDGSRSDIVLEPKAQILDLPPVLIEIQQRVDEKFMKRVIKYAVEAYKKYERDPIILIICVTKVHDNIITMAQTCSVTGCFSIPSTFWASRCFLVCDESLKTCNQVPPLQPFVSLCMFLTKNAPSITDTHCSTDTTMKMLYALARDHYGSTIGNEQHLYEALQQTIDAQQHEYDSLRDMIAREAPMTEIESAIITAQTRNETMKRQYDQIETSNSSGNTQIESESAEMYKRAMAFVDDFKQKREAKGYKRMDWVLCFDEGKKEGVFDYKNRDVLRALYGRYTKNNR